MLMLAGLLLMLGLLIGEGPPLTGIEFGLLLPGRLLALLFRLLFGVPMGNDVVGELLLTFSGVRLLLLPPPGGCGGGGALPI